ncbi:hypothetical protein OJ997_33680 [Solirubrobacter phytolaccae]|uniref:Uncharacterized protein n=1 Tax=Solirubrobacter phytolaccae TaxID=1404360 RepID=A0A9X3NEM0_9ACTN|nr:hypothetical protein [Solirubrobacter phytolaccae]MDA0185305.1 hypothetical protein [Solirubrobacter phytolaccae]
MTTFKTSRTLAAALAMTAIAAAPASAAELTYIDNDNVYVENLDGSARHALSADGTPARPYVLPTADEQGSLAAFQANPTTGQQEIVYWAYGTGTPVRNRMPRSPGDQTTSPPTSARMQPDGAYVTLGYTFLAFGDPAQPRYGRTNPSSPSLPDAQTSIDYTDITWHRERPVVARADGDVYWTGLTQPLFTSTVPGVTHTFLEISEDGSRMLLRRRAADGSLSLELFAYEGQIGFGTVPSGCAIPVGPGFARGALSRDGKSVAWDDGAGVHVAQAEPDVFDANATCVLSGTRTVSSTARMPAFSAATTALPPVTPPPPGPPSTGPLPPAPPATTNPPKFKLSAPPTKLKASALRRGVTLKAAAPAAGKVKLTLKRGKRIVASGSATAKAAGTVKVKLKAKKGAKLSGKLKLTATFTPKSGKATTTTVTVRVS